MNIKKVDDKPMVIHTKEKVKLHIKQEPEAKIKGRNVLVVDKSPKIAGTDNKEVKPDGKKPTMKGKSNAKESVRQAVQKENGIHAQMQRTKQDSKKAAGKKNSTAGTVASVGAMTALDQMDGGNEVHESYQEEFEAMKKKTKRILFVSIGAIVAAVAGLMAYKYMQ